MRARAVVLAMFALAAVPVSARSTPIVTVFADVPAPGHPAGIVVHGDRVIVSTSAGSPFHPNTHGERIFTFDQQGDLLQTTFLTEGPASNMGLGNMAFDGQGRLYVADMNGLIRRYGPGGSSDVWASSPLPYSAASWVTSMWNDLDFDARGNAYVTDGGGRIWRIGPDGAPSLWLHDRRLVAIGSGPYQAQIDRNGRYLYFDEVIDEYPDRFGSGIVYRVRLTDHPGPGDLEEIHRFSPEPADLGRVAKRFPYVGAEPNGIAIGESGRLYVALASRNQIAVLSSGGKLLRTISSPLFDYPVSLAFLGSKLLVANMDLHFGVEQHPHRWKIFSVDVGDTGIAPILPTNIP